MCMAANTKKHYDNNPQKVMDRVTKYNRQKMVAGGYCSDLDAEEIRTRQNDQCAYCNVALNGCGELDHKIPVSRGGDSSPKNMAWACTTCNRDKHSKTVEEFIRWRAERGFANQQ